MDYLSDAWLILVRHAASEAKRLGLEIGMQNCAGWATSGGPWITPANASQCLVFAEVKVKGPGAVKQKLPQPETREGYYRDIAVFAFPTPTDDRSRLPRWTTGALYRACRTDRQPSLRALPAAAAVDPNTIVDVTRHLGKDGVLTWNAPPGEWTILRLGHTPTGKTNHPAPVSGRGLEVDKFNPAALDVHWRKGIQPVLDRLGPLAGEGFDDVIIDSYEGGYANWTQRFREEFKKRRGYDPGAYLVALTGRVVGDGPDTERFLWDFRRTIGDLYADNYYGHFAKLCRDHGMTYLSEPYRGPFESMRVAAKVEMPMGEFWVRSIYVGSLKVAASAAHIHGRRLAGAEAFTAGPPDGRWQNYPGSLKRIGDLAWTRGVNRFVFHRICHQPWLDKFPGMTMGQYGTMFDRTNTWWEQGRAWMRYIARSQFLLQQGEPVGDVLCFVGEASPVVGNGYMAALKRAGYDYDLCGTDVMAELKVDDGDVVVPSGLRYRLLVLPGTPFQTPALARKVRELVRAGAAVLGPKPTHTPSLAGFGEAEKEVRAIGDELWPEAGATSKRFGKGRVFSGVSPAEALAQLGVPPAVRIDSRAPDLEWIERRTDDADIFFVSNQSDREVYTGVGFRSAGRRPELWDAERGTIQEVAGLTVADRNTWVSLDLDPNESIFVVFRRTGKPKADPYVVAAGPKSENSGEKVIGRAGLIVADDGSALLRAWSDGPYELLRASGKTGRVDVTGLPRPLTLGGPWTIRFQPGRGAPAEARLKRLISWSDSNDPGIKYFSGTATTSTSFNVPADFVKPDQEVWLDLGKVAVIAEVRLNGKDVGILWHAPFRVEVSKFLRPGANTLEVDVTNLWVNRLIGDEQYPDDCDWTDKHLTRWPDWLVKGKPRPSKQRISFTTWKHWKANDPLLPSGLIGPVTLHCARLVPVK